MVDEHLLTVREVAERLKMHPVTVQRWLRSGRMKGFRLGADKLGWRIPEAELQRVIAEARAARVSGDGGDR